MRSPCLAGVAAAPSADVAPLALATTPSGPWRAGATLAMWPIPRGLLPRSMKSGIISMATMSTQASQLNSLEQVRTGTGRRVRARESSTTRAPEVITAAQPGRITSTNRERRSKVDRD